MVFKINIVHNLIFPILHELWQIKIEKEPFLRIYNLIIQYINSNYGLTVTAIFLRLCFELDFVTITKICKTKIASMDLQIIERCVIVNAAQKFQEN